MGIKNLISDFRKWLDGEDAVSTGPDTPPARREWEEFLVSLAREIEVAMQREMFTPPGGPTYIPREYLVFLSKEDDSQWQGDKREGLQRGLFHVLSERAKELVADKDVQTKSFAIELRVDGTLEKGKFRVQPVWDSSSPKTEVKPRPKPVIPAPDPEETVAPPAPMDSAATLVRPRAPLFTLELAKPGSPSETLSFHKVRISIGRGAKDIQVDVKLDGDLEVSRKHATIECLGSDRFSVICEGRNSIKVAGKDLGQGDTAEFKAGDQVGIGIFTLTVHTSTSQAVSAGEQVLEV